MRLLIFVCLAWGVASCNMPAVTGSAPASQASTYTLLDYAVASAHPLATQAGIDILRQGRQCL